MFDAVLDNAVGSATVNVPTTTKPDTYFAPAGRDESDEFCRKMQVVENAPFLRQALDAMPNMVAILNSHRQIVSANGVLLKVLDTTVCQVHTKRPGEAVGCIHAKEGPDGCGTGRHCVTCGAVNAILESQQKEQKVVRECRILIDTPKGAAPLDVRVTATPFAVGSDKFTVAVIEDISQSKRLSVLQRIFFHDVLNTAGCIEGYAQYLVDEMAENHDVCERMIHLAGSLVEAIQSQRDLIHAESGDLKTQPVAMRASHVLEELHSHYQKHSLAENRTIEVRYAWDGIVVSDRHLLHRVLGNMVKNALEATSPGDTVSIDCHEQGDEVIFAVHNPEVMSEEVQLQIFQRSFSTKDQPGRGIGTHSMKLLGEQYLSGRVGFRSQPSTGTTFWLAVPKSPTPKSPMDQAD